MSEDQLDALRKRILLPWQVQRGSTVWAPWGKSGWSAVDIKVAQRKWAKGMRVKPRTGEEVAQGKVPKDRLLKRDPKKKGKDKPGFTPAEVFAKRDAKKAEKAPESPPPPPETPKTSHSELAPAHIQGTRYETAEQRERRLNPPGWKPESEMTPEEIKRREEAVAKLLELLGDDSTVDDW